ncbi:hypothetical protein BsWGS_08706 [Bradybaena similaris]
MRVVSCLILLILNVASGTAQNCMFHEFRVDHNQIFITSDGLCQCYNRVISCPPRHRPCQYNGRSYDHRVTFSTEEGFFCYCDNGILVCDG